MRPSHRIFLCCALAAMSAAACKNTGDNSQNKDAAKQDTSRQATSRIAANPSLTLPVLDALFYEEGFAKELKANLGLTDAQVNQLKAAAHKAVEELSEDGTGDYAGSARGAAKRSEEEIRNIIGDEKANQLFELVAKRYAGGDIEGLMPVTPNAVPKDTRIVVNAAAYRMDLFQEGRLIKSYKVGIGYPEFPLPTGMRRAETIIFNPTWTPPDEPWVKGKVKAGEPVAAGSKLNPLGPIKIPIGLPNLIHGGKAPAKLGAFASHGCVGLTNDGVQDFAQALAQLGGAPLTASDVQGYATQRTKTENYKLPKPVPVELRYETIVAENGGLRIYRDVYERGTNTMEHLQRVLDVYGVKFQSLGAPEQSALQQAVVEMNADPQGNAVATANGAVPDSATANTEARAKKGHETRTVKGRTEIFVPVVALNGKGYPAPVNLYDGGQQATAAAR